MFREELPVCEGNHRTQGNMETVSRTGWSAASTDKSKTGLFRGVNMGIDGTGGKFLSGPKCKMDLLNES